MRGTLSSSSDGDDDLQLHIHDAQLRRGRVGLSRLTGSPLSALRCLLLWSGLISPVSPVWSLWPVNLPPSNRSSVSPEPHADPDRSGSAKAGRECGCRGMPVCILMSGGRGLLGLTALRHLRACLRGWWVESLLSTWMSSSLGCVYGRGKHGRWKLCGRRGSQRRSAGEDHEALDILYVLCVPPLAT